MSSGELSLFVARLFFFIGGGLLRRLLLLLLVLALRSCRLGQRLL